MEAWVPSDPACQRAQAVLEIALGYDSVRDPAVRKLLRTTMQHLNDGVRRAVAPAVRGRNPEVLPFTAIDA